MAPPKGQFGQTVAFLEYTEMENASLGIGGGSSSCFLGFKPPVPHSSFWCLGAPWGLMVGHKGDTATQGVLYPVVECGRLGLWLQSQFCPDPMTLIRSLLLSEPESPPQKGVYVGRGARQGEGLEYQSLPPD